MSHDASWTRNPAVKGSTEAMRMALLTFSLVGIQYEQPQLVTETIGFIDLFRFTWGTEMTYCTPYLLSLGLTKSKTSLVWIAGPISGLVVQPIVGIIADKSTSRWGRRRPFIAAGTTIICACLFALGWTTEIVEFFAPESKTVYILEGRG